MRLRVLREGKEEDQGVGYLDDGTMVVIEGGRRHIGEEVEVEVTSVLQNPSGKMIFTRVASVQGAAPVATRADRGRPTLALVVAGAGYGTRLDLGMPKQYVPLLGIPMLQRTLDTLGNCPAVDALRGGGQRAGRRVLRARRWCRSASARSCRSWPAATERALSVRNGLAALAEAGTWDLVGIHDGARPLVTCDEITRTVDALAADAELAGAVLGVPTTDTIKVVDENGIVIATPDRRTIWRAQTPQIFRWEALLDAYAETPRTSCCAPPTTPRWWRPGAAGWSWSRARRRTSRSPTGWTCATPNRSSRSAVVTDGAATARRRRRRRRSAAPALRPAVGPAFRVGLGYDAHRFAPDRALVLGGVRLREHDGLLGHSDADVLVHAIMDALLGAAGLEDIGHYFPDTDPAYRRGGQHGAAGSRGRVAGRPGLAAGERRCGGHLRGAAHRAPQGR